MRMDMIPIEDAERQLTELASRVEAGEQVTLTRDGKPILDLVPHVASEPAKRGGIDYEAARQWLEERGIKDPFPYIAEDFDDPLPEDFLLRPLP